MSCIVHFTTKSDYKKTAKKQTRMKPKHTLTSLHLPSGSTRLRPHGPWHIEKSNTGLLFVCRKCCTYVNIYSGMYLANGCMVHLEGPISLSVEKKHFFLPDSIYIHKTSNQF